MPGTNANSIAVVNPLTQKRYTVYGDGHIVVSIRGAEYSFTDLDDMIGAERHEFAEAMYTHLKETAWKKDNQW